MAVVVSREDLWQSKNFNQKLRYPADNVMLCYAMLGYAMLVYAVLCYAILYQAILCYAMLCYTSLCYAMQCYAILGAVPARTKFAKDKICTNNKQSEIAQQSSS